jgi:hypothetical protein
MLSCLGEFAALLVKLFLEIGCGGAATARSRRLLPAFGFRRLGVSRFHCYAAHMGAGVTRSRAPPTSRANRRRPNCIRPSNSLDRAAVGEDCQDVMERYYNPLALGEGGRCRRWVIRVADEPWRVVGDIRRPPKPDVAATNESFVDSGMWPRARRCEKTANLGLSPFSRVRNDRTELFVEFSADH